MKYKIKAVIAKSNASVGITDERVVELDASFVHDPEECGNGFYVRISADEYHYDVIDLRHDAEFDPNRKALYLVKWAKNFWNGKDDNHCVMSLEITPAE